ncbi:acyl-ACP--UDP-N-acetylglucosamine O-acyltransferase [Alphaproteobacteria bacterium]|nr:acyl-ACP--UDP-N-acetylglucosamine O-acyltransferase [Alphaproteobacteria bacterium]
MSVFIHPTAVIDPAASLGADVSIGPFCVIGGDAVIGDGAILHAHVVIEGHTSLGAGCEVFPFAVLGCSPQHTRYAGEPSTLEIGRKCVIREHVTMHPGTAIDSMRTVVGNHGLFLAATHVAHDCVVGDHVIFANNAALGGHAKIGDHVMLGGFATVQQWCRVGDHAMIGSQSAVDSDVIPFGIAVGNRARLTGINVIGLSRRGFDDATVLTLRRLYRDLFRGSNVYSQRLQTARQTYSDSAEAAEVFTFLDKAGRNGVCQAN